jgi:adenine nucleotide transporter 17
MSLSKPLESLANANAAAMGGALATFLTFPIDTVKTKMQAASKGSDCEKFDGVSDCCSKTLKKGGAMEFFKGIEPKLLWSMFGKWVYYGAYTTFGEMYTGATGQPLSTGANLVAGYLADFSHLPVTLPFEAIATRMQTSKGAGDFRTVITNIYKDSGIAGFYKGLNTFFVLCWLPAIFNTIFTQVKNAMLKARGKSLTTPLGTLESFMLGGVARAISVTMLFPYLRAKVVIQAAAKEGKQRGAMEIIQDVYNKEGFFALYTGLGPELTRGVLSTAVTLMAKEKVMGFNKKLLGGK